MKPPQSHKPFLILAIAVTLLVGALYAYLYWQVNVSVAKAVTARDIAYTQANHKAREKDMVRLYESTAAQRQQLAGYFIPSDGTIQFIEAVESIGPISGSDLELSSIEADPLQNAKPGTRGTVRAHVEAGGSWISVYKTLLFAERLPYKISIDKVRLDAVGAGPNNRGVREWRISFDIIGTLIVTPPSTP
jgi:hypothetical protein